MPETRLLPDRGMVRRLPKAVRESYLQHGGLRLGHVIPAGEQSGTALLTVLDVVVKAEMGVLQPEMEVRAIKPDPGPPLPFASSATSR